MSRVTYAEVLVDARTALEDSARVDAVLAEHRYNCACNLDGPRQMCAYHDNRAGGPDRRGRADTREPRLAQFAVDVLEAPTEWKPDVYVERRGEHVVLVAGSDEHSFTKQEAMGLVAALLQAHDGPNLADLVDAKRKEIRAVAPELWDPRNRRDGDK